MLASITTVILIVLGSLAAMLLVGFGGLLLLASRFSKAIDASMAEDARDPARAWLQVAFGFINFRDPAYTSGDVACRASLKRDWSIESREALLQRAEKLELMMQANPAWHGIRLINMLRIGVGAGYLKAEESWERALTVGRKLQPAYQSWDEVAAAIQAALDAQTGTWVEAARKSLDDNISQLRQFNFRNVKYETQL